jgi:uncharacterized protein
MAQTPKPDSWRALTKVLLFIFACAFLLALLAPLLKSHGMASPLLLGTVATFATYALTLVFVRWEKLHPADVGAAITSRSLPRLACGFVIGLFIVTLQTGLAALTGHIYWVWMPATGLAPVLTALATYLLLACREELAFRGYPLRRLDRSFGLWPAQVLVAFLFALEHRIGGYSWDNAFFGAFVGSILFGMAALATRGLAVPIGLHAAYNFGHWLIGEKEQPGLWQPVIQQGFTARVGRDEMLIYVATFVMATIAFWYWHRRNAIPDEALQSPAS